MAGFLLYTNMSDETTSSPDTETSPVTESAPRARKAAKPRAKKQPKAAAAAEPEAPIRAEAPVAPPAPEPVNEPTAEAPQQAGNDWPEPEAASTGGNASQSESGKRKRRRRKGKGQANGTQNAAGFANEESGPVAALSEPKNQDAPVQDQRPRQNPQPQPQQQQPQRAKIDPELLTKMAWKIYLAEVSEEGVALIGDNDAKDLSRRCFRLAEIFVEEQMRRR